MQLRMYRTFKYVRDPSVPVRFGAPVSWMLTHEDTLQHQNEQGEWVDVPIVEAERPERPDPNRTVYSQ